ncbi:hypothetical protein LCGC14_2381860, partial [marine sediment metagenome]
MARKYILICFAVFLSFFLSDMAFAGSTATSGTTAQPFIDRIRYDLNEITAIGGNTGYWKDPALIFWIDEAVDEIASRTRVLESGASNIIVIADTRSYSITGTFLDVEKAEYDIGVSGVTTKTSQIYDLDRVPFAKLRLGHEKEKGYPKAFSVWDNTLYIWPIPRDDPSGKSGVTMSGNTIYVYNISFPSGVTNSSSAIETPRYFDTAIRFYVIGKALAINPVTST